MRPSRIDSEPLDDFVGQDDARIVQDQFGRHFRRISVVTRLEAAP